MTALIAASSKDYLSSINTYKGQFELHMSLIIVKEMVKKKSDLFQMQRRKYKQKTKEMEK